MFSLFCFRAWNKEFKCFSIMWYIRHYFWKESRFGTCYICCLYRALCFRKARNNLFVRYSFKQVRTAQTMLLTTKLNKIHMWLSYADKCIKQGYMPFKWMLWRLVYSEKWQAWTLKSIHMLCLGESISFSRYLLETPSQGWVWQYAMMFFQLPKMGITGDSRILQWLPH